MNIAFDSGAIEIGIGSGIGNYTLNQFSEMMQATPENEYFYFNVFNKQSGHTDLLTTANNFHKCDVYVGKDALVRRENEPYVPVFAEAIKYFIRQNKIDIFYVTSPFLGGDYPAYEPSWFEGVTVVATAWDIIPYIMRDTYLATKTAMRWYMKRIEMLKWMDRLLAISQSVKDDMVRYLNFDPDKIDVIYAGVSPKFHQITVTGEQREALAAKFKIQGEFLLCCVSADSRKNVQGAIKAYAALARQLISSCQLVIVGRLLPEKREEYEGLIRSLNMQGRVILTDYVTEQELLELYNLAKLMIIPSLYEGFGLPVVEAWACGTPVAASQNSSLGEVVGKAGILFNPKRISDITAALRYALTTADLGELARSGMQKVKDYTWANTAKLSLAAIDRAVRSRRETAAPLPRIALVFGDDLQTYQDFASLPALLAARFRVDTFAAAPLRTESGDALEDVGRLHGKDYVRILAVAAPQCLPYNTNDRDKTGWLIADETLRQLLAYINGGQPDHAKILSDVQIDQLRGYFEQDRKPILSDKLFAGYARIITADVRIKKVLAAETLCRPVYLVSPSEDKDCAFPCSPDAMREALLDNLQFATLDEKLWVQGDELIETVKAAMDRGNYAYQERMDMVETLGYAFDANPVHTVSESECAAAQPDAQAEKRLKVDLVTSWNTKCGIAEFTRFYVEAIRQRVDFAIFPPIADQLIRKDEPFVRERVWQYHQQPDALASALLRSDASVVHIQYTEGFFRTEDLTYLLERLNGSKQVLITCHNCSWLRAENDAQRMALNTAQYIVHNKNEIDKLRKNGIDKGNIRLGILGQPSFLQYDKHEVRRRLGLADRTPILGSYGFLLPHKGIYETILAVKTLFKQYPNMLYIACCALYPDYPLSDEYYRKCQDTIAQLQLEQHVVMIPDFLEPEEASYILQACDATVIPYGKTQESGSASVRFCAGAGRPILTTRSDIFSDFSDCAYQISDNKPERIAKGILEMLQDEHAAEKLRKLQRKVAEISFRNVADTYFAHYRELLAKTNGAGE